MSAALVDQPVLTVGEAAKLLKLSEQTVLRMFEHEPGVLILDRPEKMHKRRYRTIRIPRPVFDRLIGQLSVRQ